MAVLEEQYTWQAETSDELFQEGVNDSHLSKIFELNKQGKLVNFSVANANKKILCVIALRDSQKLIFFRRRMNHISNRGQLTWTITCVGWEENVRGVSAKTMLYIYPNGSMELANGEPTMSEVYHQHMIELFLKEKSDGTI